jgi:hypothetical protein
MALLFLGGPGGIAGGGPRRPTRASKAIKPRPCSARAWRAAT